jgi:DNA replication and repair protein RecF
MSLFSHFSRKEATMHLKTLNLTNFRNYYKKTFDFEETNLIIGPNTSGKTNLLEAIYILCNSKSFKSNPEVGLISWDKSFARITGATDSQLMLEVFLEKIQNTERIKKTLKVNSLARIAKTFADHLSCVLFKPQDLELMDGSPSLRRNFLNEAVASADPDFTPILAKYENIVRSRNKLLTRVREGFESPVNLSFWNNQLLKLAEQIERERESFAHFVDQFLISYTSQFRILTTPTTNNHPEEGSPPKFEYTTKPLTPRILQEIQPREIASTQTLHGPHRADFKILIHNKDMAIFGSRGQQRALVLGLKLAQLEYAAQKRECRPLLLLDDIFSELDKESERAVMSAIGKQQTFITGIWDKKKFPGHQAALFQL